jgi:hypothetical protein
VGFDSSGIEFDEMIEPGLPPMTLTILLRKEKGVWLRMHGRTAADKEYDSGGAYQQHFGIRRRIARHE